MSSHCSKCKNRCIHSNTKFTLSIPQFTHNKIYVEDYGDFDGIQYGNLLVNIDLLDHQVYKIQGQNIQRNIKIGIDDFLTGAKINFKYLNNQQISVEIPKLNTKPIIIKGLGVSTKSKSGDLILYIKVENNIDPKKTTEQIINLLNCHSIEDNTYQKY